MTNKPLHHLRWKQTLRPQATLQQLLLPGLITGQTLLQGSSDNKLISQMTEYALHYLDAKGLHWPSMLSLASIKELQ